MYGRGRGFNHPHPHPPMVAANGDGDILRGATHQDGTKTHSSLDDDNNNIKPHSHDPFDICPPPTRQNAPAVVLKPPLLVTNRERRKQGAATHPQVVTLRPGMIHLKKYISVSDQVSIVKKCRELGKGPGGFYQPGYGDADADADGEGAKLHLKMMCLGKNWDPLSSRYTDRRPSDGAKPPEIPPEFLGIVSEAMALANKLPPITPDICIVNFYSRNGRLGLHQDKDESEESLRQGLPVVSFSVGDSADFLYGDTRDVDKAKKLVLESGDVLIFGGNSRNAFHGVSAIHPMTAPATLLQQTNLLRPGRLNLTFRQY
ncbi:hypothetical protein PIB30_011709 [Stylosanthes scabra]|uniref:Fe2OG dioxygenase domain-containing protein n=1 Tax=Stylosanthes scabra TaxID=79078 RepID=A0ABU6Y491_9FABA|nr:hypothetical protein [Stylosanthes scabra]